MPDHIALATDLYPRISSQMNLKVVVPAPTDSHPATQGRKRAIAEPEQGPSK